MCILAFLCLHRVVFVCKIIAQQDLCQQVKDDLTSHLLPARLSPRCTLRLRASKTSVEPAIVFSTSSRQEDKINVPFKSRPYSSQPLLSSIFTSSRVLPPYTISDSLDSGSNRLSKILTVHRKAYNSLQHVQVSEKKIVTYPSDLAHIQGNPCTSSHQVNT